jgi:hypothetical protein
MPPKPPVFPRRHALAGQVEDREQALESTEPESGANDCLRQISHYLREAEHHQPRAERLKAAGSPRTSKRRWSPLVHCVSPMRSPPPITKQVRAI